MYDGGGVPEMHFIMKGWSTPDLDDYYMYTCFIPYILCSNDNVGTPWHCSEAVPTYQLLYARVLL